VSDTPDDDAIDRFRALIARRLGLHFDGGKHAFLADALRRGVDEAGLDPEAYLDLLAIADAAGREWRALARVLTVTETYFFRNNAQFAALREFILSEWRQSRPAPSRLAILSAGCASGEEPYSIAMLLDELALPECQASIRGIDINVAMLIKAAGARYSAWSLRETADARRARYFTQQGNDCVLDAAIRNAATFEARSLHDEDAAFWRPDAFDIVFCRNVLMYFTPAAARAAIARIARSLAPGGLLFLGHAETLRGLSRDFQLRHTHGTFYYQRKDALEPMDAAAPGADPVWETLPPAPDGAGAGVGVAWYEVIESAAERVRSLAARPAKPGEPRRAASAGDELTRAMVLLGREHYAEALAILNALPADAARESAATFLRAVLLMNRGDLAAAERLCHALMMRDGVSAGAHYLMALCREAGGDCRAAAAHDRHAAALDPAFAMPRLHLGLLARRTGDRDGARRELARAAALLPTEKAERLLLFGGGFGRDALLALCRAELASAGGAA
jgi:chemotaxis protein methyltransferase CheR